MVLNKAVFLDRDGVLNEDRGTYTFRIADFRVLPGVWEALRAWQEKGYLLIVITNQGGIAKGLYSPADVDEVHQHFSTLCADHGIQIQSFWYSPNHDVVSRSLDRKPGSLLLERALYREQVDPAISYMIGDKERDIEAGRQAGTRTIHVPTNGNLASIITDIP